MSKKTASLAKTNIRKHFAFFNENLPSILSKPIRELKFSDLIVNKLKSYGIFSLRDLDKYLDNKEFIYELEKNNKTMTKLSRAISHLKKEPQGKKENTKIHKNNKNRTKKGNNKIRRQRAFFKKYRYNDFLNLAEWKKKSSVVSEKEELLVKTKTGFEFYVGSNDEKIIFNKFNKSDDVIDIRGQDLVIPYKGKNGINSEYHPDLVIFFKDGAIQLFEVKPVIQMAMHDVLLKYVAMKEYAEKYGYLYTMGGVSNKRAPIKTFDEIRKRKPDKNFKAYVERIINKKGYFQDSDLQKYKKLHKLVGKGETNVLYYDLANIVIKNLNKHYMYNRKGKSIHSWRIIRPKYVNRIIL